MVRAASLLIVGLLASPAVAEVEVELEPPKTPPRPRTRIICAIGRPAPHCASVAVIELGYGRGRSSEGKRYSNLLGVQGGLVVNLGSRHAVGATAGLIGFNRQRDTDTDESDIFDLSFGGFMRYRLWLYDYTSLDVSLGLGGNGGLAEVALGLGDMVAVTAGVHAIPTEEGRGHATTIGIRITGFVLAAIWQALPSSPRLPTLR